MRVALLEVTLFCAPLVLDNTQASSEQVASINGFGPRGYAGLIGYCEQAKARIFLDTRKEIASPYWPNQSRRPLRSNRTVSRETV